MALNNNLSTILVSNKEYYGNMTRKVDLCLAKSVMIFPTRMSSDFKQRTKVLRTLRVDFLGADKGARIDPTKSNYNLTYSVARTASNPRKAFVIDALHIAQALARRRLALRRGLPLLQQ